MTASPPPSRRSRKDPSSSASSAGLAPPYGPYDEVVGATLDALRQSAARHGTVSLGTKVVGRSVQGRAIDAIWCRGLSPAADGPRPRVIVVANLHGVEHVGVHVALGVLRAVVEGRAESLARACELVVVPSANPDGFATTVARGGVGRVAQLRCNANGVDLNRNFPRPHGVPASRLPFTGSSKPGRATYRGPTSLSEPESAALAALIAEAPVAAVFSLHSFMGRLILPCTRSLVDHDGYGVITSAFRKAQTHTPYPTLANRRFDVFTGELEDFVHHELDAWAMCVETFPIRESLRQHLRAPSTFWRFNPRDVERWVNNDVPGILAAAAVALQLGPPSAHRHAGSARP